MSIHVHIERLVLDGFPLSAADGRQVKAAILRELRALLAANGVSDELRSGGALPAVQARAFNPQRGASPAQLGQQIARSVHGGIGKAK